MSSFIPHEGSRFKPKSFWRRPEGVTGAIILIGSLAGLTWLGITFFQQIIAWTENIYALTGMIAFVAIVLFFVIDPKMRRILTFFYKNIMRGITSIFTTMNPVKVLKNYVKDIRKNIRKTEGQMSKMRTQMRQITGMVEKNKRDIERNLKQVQKAKSENDEKNVVLNTRKSARLKESNDKFQILLEKMERIYSVLEKAHANAKILLDDTESQVQQKEQERKAVRTAHSAMDSAKSVLGGKTNEREQFNIATEEIAEDISDKIGEMERFMELSDNFMESVDLESARFENDDILELEQLEKASDLLAMPAKTKAPAANNKYDDLF